LESYGVFCWLAGLINLTYPFLVLAAPWIARGASILDRALMRGLLGPGRLAQRGRDLGQTRAQAVGARAGLLLRLARRLAHRHTPSLTHEDVRRVGATADVNHPRPRKAAARSRRRPGHPAQPPRPGRADPPQPQTPPPPTACPPPRSPPAGLGQRSGRRARHA